MYSEETGSKAGAAPRTPFGAWLRERRRARDLTQEELADRVGCSPDTIRKIEVGQRRPSRQVAELLAADLGVHASEWSAFVLWARTEGTAQLRNSTVVSPLPAAATKPAHESPLQYSVVDGRGDADLSLVNPYKGLLPFSESDAPYFFGREALVDDLLARLGEEGEFANFLAIVGPSGSGKSSLVRAGLIPRLRSLGLPGGLVPVVAECRPGTVPAQEIRSALVRSFSVPSSATGGLGRIGSIPAEEWSITDTALQLLSERDETGILLFIDQFEEVFTLPVDEDARANFFADIFVATSDSRLRDRLWVVITLRADFYDRPLGYPGISQMMAKRTEAVTPMTRAELRRAILGPAEHVGIELEPHLADAIEQDVGTQPGMLPLMEYALSELFERRQGQLMTLQGYTASGGVKAALVRRAEAIYEELTSAEQREATQMFLRLASVGESAESARRRVLRSELVSAALDEEALDQVLDAFGEHRLLTFDREQSSGRPTVEVAHEALLSAWIRLREWVDASRDALQVRKRLMPAAADWEHAGRDPSYLSRGSQLGQFEALAAQGNLSLTGAEQTYVRASLAAQEQDRAQQERRRRVTVGGLAAGLVLTAILTIVAIGQSLEASEQRDSAVASANARATAQAFAEDRSKEAQEQQLLAFSRELAAQSQNKLASNPNLCLLLAIEAAKRSRTKEFESTLRQALIETQPHTLLRYPGGGGVTSASFSWDGTLVATTGALTTRVWEVSDRTANSGNLVAELPNLRDELPDFAGVPAGITAAFSPNGKRVVVVTRSFTPVVWDVATRSVTTRLVGHRNIVNSARFSPDDSHIVTASDDKTIRIWDATTGQAVTVLQNDTGIVNDAEFSVDSKRIVSASDDDNAKVWDVTRGRVVATLSGHAGWVNTAAFSPDGKLVVTASSDKTARVWEVATGKSLVRLAGHKNVVNSAQFSRDGKLVITGGNDNVAGVWDATSGQMLAEIDGGEIAPASSVLNAMSQLKVAGFSADSRRVLIVTGGSDMAARIYSWQLFTPIEQLLPLAISVTPRQLTCEERQLFLHETTKCATPSP